MRAWVLASLAANLVLTSRDFMKLLSWNATTGRGYSRSVRVCSAKFPRMFGELKKRICTAHQHIQARDIWQMSQPCDNEHKSAIV